MLNTYLKYCGTPIETLKILEALREAKEKIMKLSSDKPFLVGRFRFLNWKKTDKKIKVPEHVTLPTGQQYIPVYKVLGSWTPWKSNLIVNNGRLNLLNQWANTNYGPVQGMGVGSATSVALGDTNLGTEATRLSVSATVNGSPNFNVTFQSTFTAAQIVGSSAIGLFDHAIKGSGTMLTKSVFSAISIPEGSSMTVQYQVSLSTGVYVTGFTLTGGQSKTYQKANSTSVAGVVEMNTGQGYTKVTSVSAVESTPGSYYLTGGVLYVHTSNDANPSSHRVLVISGAT